MTFDPSGLGLISNTGNGRSETVFLKNKNFLNVIGDGHPAPARADSTGVKTQSYNYSFLKH